MQLDERYSWDEARISMAREIAKRSLCSRDQVGAIIVDVRNRIIGEGYNGPPSGFKHGGESCENWCLRAAANSSYRGDYSDCPSLHAEANALMMSDRTARQGGTIYVTSFPCSGCLKLISNSGLNRIVVGVDGAHEYRYRESDYETVRRLGFGIAFEDGRQFEHILSTAYGWIDVDGTKVSTLNAQNWCAPSEPPIHQRAFNGNCVHGCDPNSTSCD